MNLQTIRERRATTIAAMRALTEAAGREDRDLSDDEKRAFDSHKATLGRLDGDLERATFLADAERSMAVDPKAPRRGNDGTFEEACGRFSVTRAIGGMIAPSEVDAGLEHEVSREIATRTGRKPQGIWIPHEIFREQRAVTTAGSGGNLVERVLRDDLFIDRLRQALTVQRLGATVLNDLVPGAPVDLPRLTGSAATYWVAEHSAITSSDHTYDKVSLAPKTVGALVEYSRRMLLNATPSVENVVRMDLTKAVATEIDAKAIAGDGTGNTPTGVLNVSGTNAVDHGATGGPPTWAKVLEFIESIDLDNALAGALGWLTNGKVVRKARSTPKVASTDSVMIMQEPGSLAGYPLLTSNAVPSNFTEGAGSNLSGAIFGNWADLLVGYWGALDIVPNPYSDTVYSKGGVLIIALQDVDVQVRHPESFSVAKDMSTT